MDIAPYFVLPANCDISIKGVASLWEFFDPEYRWESWGLIRWSALPCALSGLAGGMNLGPDCAQHEPSNNMSWYITNN
jgi:hypothetical protein